MSTIEPLQTALVHRILNGQGKAPASERQNAFSNTGLSGPVATLIEKVVNHPATVTDADIDETKATGLSEDQIFELVVCAAVGQASRQYDAAMAAVDAATKGN